MQAENRRLPRKPFFCLPKRELRERQTRDPSPLIFPETREQQPRCQYTAVPARYVHDTSDREQLRSRWLRGIEDTSGRRLRRFALEPSTSSHLVCPPNRPGLPGQLASARLKPVVAWQGRVLAFGCGPHHPCPTTIDSSFQARGSGLRPPTLSSGKHAFSREKRGGAAHRRKEVEKTRPHHHKEASDGHD